MSRIPQWKRFIKWAVVASRGDLEDFKKRDPRIADAWLALNDREQAVLRAKYDETQWVGTSYVERLSRALLGEAYDRAVRLNHKPTLDLMFGSAKVALRLAENEFQRNLILLDDAEGNMLWQPE